MGVSRQGTNQQQGLLPRPQLNHDLEVLQCPNKSFSSSDLEGVLQLRALQTINHLSDRLCIPGVGEKVTGEISNRTQREAAAGAVLLLLHWHTAAAAAGGTGGTASSPAAAAGCCPTSCAVAGVGGATGWVDWPCVTGQQGAGKAPCSNMIEVLQQTQHTCRVLQLQLLHLYFTIFFQPGTSSPTHMQGA